MTYQVLIPKPVQKQLDKLSDKARDRVLKVLLALKENPRPRGTIKLTDIQSEYRIRIGNYRIRYEVDDQKLIVLILHLKHRKDAYRM
jgi:mRNA interferase RelE/StbE